MNKAVFLDRDGVINEKAPEGEYVIRWEKVRILPRVSEAIARLNGAGYLVIVVTNQRCVAKGLITTDELEVLHSRLCAEVKRSGAIIDDIYYCPHDYQHRCGCRKPAPGMLLRAAAEKNIALAESWMIGDSDADVQAGKTAGCTTVRIKAAGETLTITADITVGSLFEAVDELTQRHQRG